MRYPMTRKEEGSLPRRTTDVWDRMFEDFLRGFGLSPLAERAETFVPDIDVTEDENEVTVKAELPGMTAEDIDVSVEDTTLTLRGEKKHEEEKEEGGYRRVERRYGSFQRRIQLPSGVKEDDVDAVFKNGVLTIKMPKAEEARGRRIDIKTG